MKPKITKTIVAAKSRKLTAKWTFEPAQDVENCYDPLAEKQIADMLAGEIQREIDQEVMIAVTNNWPNSVYRGDLNVGKIFPDLLEGWAGKLIIRETADEDQYQKYLDIVRWINSNIANPKQNAHWTKESSRIYVLVRRPADLTALLLRWG